MATQHGTHLCPTRKVNVKFIYEAHFKTGMTAPKGFAKVTIKKTTQNAQNISKQYLKVRVNLKWNCDAFGS